MPRITIGVKLSVSDAITLPHSGGSGTSKDPYQISIQANQDSQYVVYVATPATFVIKGQSINVVENTSPVPTINLPNNGNITFNIKDAGSTTQQISWNHWNPSLTSPNSELKAVPGQPVPANGQDSWNVIAQKVPNENYESLTMYCNVQVGNTYYLINWDPKIIVKS